MKAGLSRLSLAVWGLIAAALASMAWLSTVNPERAARGDWMIYLSGAAIAIGLHFVCLWVIAGFTRATSAPPPPP